ncbi:protein-lysine methyltransferase METTL21D-like [Acropora millepora]|uniref:protein-lysine methyltransferase METTL21D-like n=1 Tax=Acropora millepora TaxID=45264 RepID=UPI001CF26D01|nr:protein-lysine methyltransferase METTL21D-like [Acropora millepora]
MAVKLGSLLADKTFEREIECGHGTLKIKQAEVGDESCVVWDAALVLAKYLQKLHLSNKATEEGLENKRIIELGAGTGVVGLMAAACGAAVCCTDLTSVVPLIELNKTVNQHLITGSFSAASLKWGQDVTAFLPCPDILLVADCIYYEESLAPLVTTLCDLSDFNTTVLLSYEERTTGNKPLVEKQFHQLVKAHFFMEEIPEEEQDSIYHSPDIYLWRLKRR